MREGKSSKSREGSYDDRSPGRLRPRKMFIGNLPVDITDAELRPLLAAAGTVRSLNIRSARASGARPKSLFAHVEFEREEDCHALFRVLDARVFKGRTLRVEWCDDKGRQRNASASAKRGRGAAFPSSSLERDASSDLPDNAADGRRPSSMGRGDSVGPSYERRFGAQSRGRSFGRGGDEEERGGRGRRPAGGRPTGGEEPVAPADAAGLFPPGSGLKLFAADGTVTPAALEIAAKLTREDLFAILDDIQSLSAQMPATARKVLSENPLLCHALLHAQLATHSTLGEDLDLEALPPAQQVQARKILVERLSLELRLCRARPPSSLALPPSLLLDSPAGASPPAAVPSASASAARESTSGPPGSDVPRRPFPAQTTCPPQAPTPTPTGPMPRGATAGAAAASVAAKASASLPRQGPVGGPTPSRSAVSCPPVAQAGGANGRAGIAPTQSPLLLQPGVECDVGSDGKGGLPCAGVGLEERQPAVSAAAPADDVGPPAGVCPSLPAAGPTPASVPPASAPPLLPTPQFPPSGVSLTPEAGKHATVDASVGSQCPSSSAASPAPGAAPPSPSASSQVYGARADVTSKNLLPSVPVNFEDCSKPLLATPPSFPHRRAAGPLGGPRATAVSLTVPGLAAPAPVLVAALTGLADEAAVLRQAASTVPGRLPAASQFSPITPSGADSSPTPFPQADAPQFANRRSSQESEDALQRLAGRTAAEAGLPQSASQKTPVVGAVDQSGHVTLAGGLRASPVSPGVSPGLEHPCGVSSTLPADAAPAGSFARDIQRRASLEGAPGLKRRRTEEEQVSHAQPGAQQGPVGRPAGPQAAPAAPVLPRATLAPGQYLPQTRLDPQAPRRRLSVSAASVPSSAFGVRPGTGGSEPGAGVPQQAPASQSLRRASRGDASGGQELAAPRGPARAPVGAPDAAAVGAAERETVCSPLALILSQEAAVEEAPAALVDEVMRVPAMLRNILTAQASQMLQWNEAQRRQVLSIRKALRQRGCVVLDQ
ncbi:RNA recognition motif-containing protein [Besnoitia besnoiti]|uniref:RNA recognition motif-containing protein n=1 Tax=Besnoitia besnoiti TaxID=94643 RepID=A0A2A9MB93_BESBE|nr:RNA recognition motif-containing protein [Besnoitia besnoiti]PFH32662.1 RNA recognition motif-containing protein [Besnoitia besnoiti]